MLDFHLILGEKLMLKIQNIYKITQMKDIILNQIKLCHIYLWFNHKFSNKK